MGSTPGVFAYDEAKATTAEGHLGTLMTDLDLSLKDLGGFVVKVKADWDGDEMELYDAVYQQWSDNAETVQKILDGVFKAIGSVTGGVHDLREGVRNAMKEQG